MLLKKNKKNTPKEQVTNNKVQKSKVKYSSNQPSIKEKIVPAKVITPKTCQDMFKMFFKSTNEELDLIEISDNIYSMCVEFEDVSFAKADYSTVENIFLKWVEFLNSFSEHIHIQVLRDTYICIQRTAESTFTKYRLILMAAHHLVLHQEVHQVQAALHQEAAHLQVHQQVHLYQVIMWLRLVECL